MIPAPGKLEADKAGWFVRDYFPDGVAPVSKILFDGQGIGVGIDFANSAFTTGIALGTDSSKLTLASNASRLAQMYSTSALTTGRITSLTVSQTMTALSTGNYPEVAQFFLTSNVKTGAWANAVYAKIDYSTNGLAHGVAGVVCAELDLPGSSVARGTYVFLQAEVNCPANCAMNSNPIHIIQINSWGTNKTQFDAVGHLFELTGVGSGVSNFWYDHQGAAPGNIEEWVRVKTPGGTRYLALYNAVV